MGKVACRAWSCIKQIAVFSNCLNVRERSQEVKIELLYFEGCPSYQTALECLEEVIKEQKLSVHVEMVKIESDEEALKNRFLGSPTVRVNGLDIEPSARERGNFSMCCRLYPEAGKMVGWPSKDLIRHAIEEAL